MRSIPPPRVRRAAGLWSVALCALLFSACAGSGEPTGPEVDDLTAESELPPEFRDAWRAWYEDSPEWEAWRERAALDPDLRRFLVDNLVRVMIKFYDHSALIRAGDLPGYFERARRELEWFDETSGPVLVELVRVGDGVVAVLAGHVLVRLDDARWTLAVSELCKSPEAEVRRRAAELCGELPHALEQEDLVLARLEALAAEDPEWHVRAQAVRALGERALRGSDADRIRRDLSRALADPDRAVVIEAAERLAATEDLEAVPALLNQLERRERGGGNDIGVLRALAGALTDLSQREDVRGSAAWRAWWRENRPDGGSRSGESVE